MTQSGVQAKAVAQAQSESGMSHDTMIKRIFLMPAIFILLSLSIFPMLWSVGISFTDYQRGGRADAAQRQTNEEGEVIEQDNGFLGLGFDLTLRNYERLFEDSRLHSTIRNTFIFVFGGVILQYWVGFGLALVLNQPFMGRNIVRIVFLLPMMMTPVAAAYTGRMLFDSSKISPLAEFQSMLSDLLGTTIKVPWLTDGFWAPITIVLIDSWQWIPFMTLLLLAGLQGIPEEIYEAAHVDGATKLQILRKITFPILLPISTVVILIRALEIFKIIDVIKVTTGGGPGSATESLTMYIFDTALTSGNYAYAASISLALLVCVIIFAMIFLAVMRRFTATVA